MDIAVICGKCFGPCPSNGVDRTTGFIRYILDQPCPRCGAMEWVAHEPGRDPKTGRPLSEKEKESKKW